MKSGKSGFYRINYRSFVRRRQSEQVGLNVTRAQRSRFRASFHGDNSDMSEDLDELFQRE